MGALALGFVGGQARADLPPPPGQTRVDYRFRVDAVPDGVALVAFPTYNFEDNGGRVVSLVAGKDVRSFQGYRPGIYAVAAADAAAVPRTDDAAAFLAERGRVCVKEVPRVFQVATTTGITRMTDVIHVTATATSCSSSLVTTIYEGDGGARGEGGIDASGRRVPPAPFGGELPDVSAAGFVGSTVSTPVAATATATPTGAPAAAPAATPEGAKAGGAATPEGAKAGGAGCSVDDRRGGTWLLGALLLARRRRRRG